MTKLVEYGKAGHMPLVQEIIMDMNWLHGIPYQVRSSNHHPIFAGCTEGNYGDPPVT